MLDWVIVRDSLNNLLRRLAVGRGKYVIYVVAEDAVDAVERGEISAIGFPINDVFTTNSGEAAMPVDWTTLRPYGI